MQLLKADIELDGIDSTRPVYTLATHSRKIRHVLMYIYPELESSKNLDVSQLLDGYVVSDLYEMPMLWELVQEKLL